MAINYTVRQLRGGQASFSQDLGSTDPTKQITWDTTWEVLFTGLSDPSDVTEMDAGNVNGLPLLGSDVFVSPLTGFVLPFCIVNKVSCSRDTENANRFLVDIGYKNITGGQQQPGAEAPAADPQDYKPTIAWAAGGMDVTAWAEAKSSGSKACLLPTGNLYAQPCIRKVPTYTATVTQYENNFSFTALKDRMFKCNKRKWKGFGIYCAMITAIKWDYVRVPIAGGFRNSYRVSYTIDCKDYVIQNLTDAGTVSTLTHVGHEAARLRTDGVANTIADDPTSAKPVKPKDFDHALEVYLKTDGTVHAPANQKGPPPVDLLELQEKIDFSFLRA